VPPLPEGLTYSIPSHLRTDVVITLHPGRTGPSDVEVKCIGMSGAEVAALKFSPEHDRPLLFAARSATAEKLGLPVGKVQLVLPDGTLLPGSRDATPLPDIVGPILERAA